MPKSKQFNSLNEFYNILATTALHKIRYTHKLSQTFPNEFDTWPAEFTARVDANTDVMQAVENAQTIAESEPLLSRLKRNLQDRKHFLTTEYIQPSERKSDVYLGGLINVLDTEKTLIDKDLLTDEKDGKILLKIQEQERQKYRDQVKQRITEVNRNQRSHQPSSRTSSSPVSSSRRNDDDDMSSLFNNNISSYSGETSTYRNDDPTPTNNDFDFGGGNFGGGGGGGEYRKEESRPKRFGFEKLRF